ncbi:MAG: gliding motility-associated C-terminal domain-containing protein, partial [Bacteroidota bacterium]
LSGNVNPTNIYSSEGNYDVEMIVVKGTCSDTIRKKITVVTSLEDIISTKDTTLCYGNSLKILAKPALNFCWSPSTFLDNASSQNPTTSTPQNITYYLTAEAAGTNLITNGDFSSGNTGFTSAYNFTNVNITEGEYSVGTNPQTWNSSLSSCKDHTSGVGKMLLVNGSPAADVNVWKQTITVLPNTNYAFSTWIQALWDPNPAQLQFSINGKPLGSQITASLPTCSWSQFYTTWNSGNNTTAEISIVNKNTQIQGNDFALDDISFAPVSIKKDSIKINVETPFVKTGNDTLVCANSPVPLFAVGSLNYVWNPANGLNNPSTANPTAVTSTSTQYIVTGTSANGCTAKDTVNVSVIPAPVINKSADIAICKNSSTQLFVSGGISYSWSPQTGLDNSFISNPVASPASSSTYVVTVTDVNNCTNKDSIKVTIRPDPVFSVNENENICSGGSINLKATGGNQYSWQPQESLDNPFIPAPSATPANTTNYSVLIKDTVCGGSATLATTITVLPAPLVKANKSNDIDCSVGSSQLSATGAVQYEWLPAASLNNTGIANPVATPVIPTEYVVKGTNNSGCSSIDSVLVDVKAINKGKFLMPSAFTPNNDGHNDCYGAKYWGFITEFDFSIFNRWGECVFHTKNPSQCWDGFYKGVPQNADVYVYIIKAKSFCESSVFRKGTVALIR